MAKKKKVWKSPAMAQAMRSKEDKLRETLTQIVSGQSRLLHRPEDLYEAIANGIDDIENFKNRLVAAAVPNLSGGELERVRHTP